VELIKSKFSDYRITVNPDSVSLTDFAALKQERGEFAQTIATYFQGMMPLIQMAGAAGMVAPTVEFVSASPSSSWLACTDRTRWRACSISSWPR
jgi:hypothetical protein